MYGSEIIYDFLDLLYKANSYSVSATNLACTDLAKETRGDRNTMLS